MIVEFVSHLLTKLGLKQEPDGTLHTTLGTALDALATQATLAAVLIPD